jgi:hypothetical protein
MLSEGVTAARSVTDRVLAVMPRVAYRRATTSPELEAIYRLRYDAYRREQALEERDSRRLDDKFDGDKNAYQLGVFLDGLSHSYRDSCAMLFPSRRQLSGHSC